MRNDLTFYHSSCRVSAFCASDNRSVRVLRHFTGDFRKGCLLGFLYRCLGGFISDSLNGVDRENAKGSGRVCLQAYSNCKKTVFPFHSLSSLRRCFLHFFERGIDNANHWKGKYRARLSFSLDERDPIHIRIFMAFLLFQSVRSKTAALFFYAGMVFSLLRVERWTSTLNSSSVWRDFVLDFFLPLYIAIGGFALFHLLRILRNHKK